MSRKEIDLYEKFYMEGSQEAFSALFDYYYIRLKQFANTITRSDVLSEEVVADVFLRLWKQKKDNVKISNINTYLFVAIRNASLNKIRDERRFSFDMLGRVEMRLAAYEPQEEKYLVETEMMQTLERAVDRLPAKCKVIFKLIREDGLNRNEVACILGLSVKTVDNQMAIAVKKIAAELGIDLSDPIRSHFLLAL